MFKKTDRKAIDTQSDYLRAINTRMTDMAKSIENTRKELNDLYWQMADAKRDNAVLETKVELYEKFIAKMLENDPDKSNEVIMYEGELYRLVSSTVSKEPGEPKTLDASFRCTSDTTFIFKNGVEDKKE